MHEDLRDSPVEYHHQLASSSRRVAESLGSDPALEPGLASLLVAGSDLQCRMPRRTRKLGCRAQETAPFPFRIAGRAGHLVEHASDLLRESPFGLVEPLHEAPQRRLVARIKVGRDQVVLAAEMIVERPLRNARLLGDLIDADGPNAIAVEQLIGGLDDPAPRLR